MVRGGVLALGPSHCDLVYLKQLWGSTEVGDDRDVVNPLVWSRVKVQVLHDSIKIYIFSQHDPFPFLKLKALKYKGNPKGTKFIIIIIILLMIIVMRSRYV